MPQFTLSTADMSVHMIGYNYT